jgi:ligand-binding sensor domain-containing protein
MTKKYISILLILIGSIYSLQAQIEWKSYATGEIISRIAMHGTDLWVATYGDGLIKINTLTGDSTFYIRTNSGIPSNEISDMVVDKNGIVYLVCQIWDNISSSTIFRFDGNKTWEPMLPYSINGMTVDSNDTVWVVTASSELYKITGKKAVKLPIYALYDYTSIAVDENGIQWIGTKNNGLVKYNNGTILKVYNDSTFVGLDRGITGIVCDHNLVWITTGESLIRFDGTTFSKWDASKAGLIEIGMTRPVIDDLHNVWIASGKGVVKFDGTDFTMCNDTNSMYPGGEATDLVIGKNGDKWVGTEGKGLYKFKDTTFIKYTTSNSGLPINIYTCWVAKTMTEDKNGTKWFPTCSNYSGVLSFDGTNWLPHPYSYKQGLGVSCNDIYCDPDGAVWSTYYESLLKFDGTNWTEYPCGTGVGKMKYYRNLLWICGYSKLLSFDGSTIKSYNAPNTGFFNGIAFTKKRVCWLSTGDKGLYTYDGNSFTNYTTANSGIASNNNTCIGVDSSGNIWAGSQAQGLSKFDGKNWTIYNQSNSQLPGNQVWDINVDKNGVIWVCTFSGLVKIDGQQWVIYNRANSPVQWPGAISFDKKGNKWIAVADGYLVMKGDPVLSNDHLTASKMAVTLYPNPVHEITFLHFKNEPTEKNTFILYDLTGKAVTTIDNITSATISINLQGLSKGMYLYSITDKSGLIGNGKLIIQ